ncbi:MAG: hypothetical protein A2787_02955 [Omnitrophica WOR_2 bacterium RIFCSPHIGHO2_01_FULL_48_9]|nr:MAG: hypothetical protein A3D10_00710 [Omnitrophica WOR_2 bacterium RIFCSPHIGHO2_02_FULL_48_11]OGX33716.1 MAG: hypothetical protein A2787_02955 [Omnitrophica WOR_2 bacterium RIFCSPHIGHO2_01_FULL_48_9]
MAKKKNLYHWSSQEIAKGCEIIECKEYDPYKHFRRDPSGFYLLIRPNFNTYRIEIAVCNKAHNIVKIFNGRKAQDLYVGILDYEKKHHCEWFKDKTHIAYLGKELKKVEIALATGSNAYFQE